MAANQMQRLSEFNDLVVDLQQQLKEVSDRLESALQEKRSLEDMVLRQRVRIRLLEDDIHRRSAIIESLEVKNQELSTRNEVLEEESQRVENISDLGGPPQEETRRTANATTELQALQSQVSAFCGRIIGVELDSNVWFLSDQTFGDMRSPKDNETLALVDMLCDELKTATLLPVEGLLMVLSAGLEAAPSHREDTLLVSLWQLVKMLEEVFPDEPRFSLWRRAMDDELLSSSPWCSRITQAIIDGAIIGLCLSQDAQFYEAHGLGVLIGPRIKHYLALDLRSQRMWMFKYPQMAFDLDYKKGNSIIIPGASTGPIKCWVHWYPRIATIRRYL
ncbi:hypothetical protein C8A03DRAFT_37747 [Achaetomium macrosporum]|uniref:Uncharacterized protein n=1 Tax=Achaetomium macrosporum TaxID=79813 RepID=A0AAN7C3T4_9PEZI|nr:hypothetical protein C8A03DRAFT_37747 [Achaetomium macrosporum]